jgi:hypothetical protein
MYLKPVNWPAIVKIEKFADTPRNMVLYEAYERGERLRLDSKGINLARNCQGIPIECLARKENLKMSIVK